jgi:RNA polymerase sigma-70 factor (ECF subfamily)
LVDVQGYSVEAAAKELNCPTGTIKSRCSRGRAKLAESLEHLRNQDVGEIVTTEDRKPSGKTTTGKEE